MRLYIVRHGKAADTSECCSGAACSKAAEDEKRISTIVSSRYPRSLQTAHAIQRSLACDVQTDVRLEVDHEVSEALAIIQENDEQRPLMLVGHNPQLGELISVLCSGLAPQELILKTGEMVVIDVRRGQPVGSGKLVDRIRLCDNVPADDTVTSAVETLVRSRPG
jgi:phosphohistidine phosphatase SixA